MADGIVLSLCDYSGVMVAPWLDAGYECWTVDLRHEPGIDKDGLLVKVGADISTWLPPLTEYRIVFGFPPCTHLAISGARWFQEKGLRSLAEGIALVARCEEVALWSGAPWAIENPVGTLSTYWRKPDHMFDPCDFGGYLDPVGDAYTKRTCLWTGGGFEMPTPKPVVPFGPNPIHMASPGPDRGDRRSVTPAGFARAVFLANEEVSWLSARSNRSSRPSPPRSPARD